MREKAKSKLLLCLAAALIGLVAAGSYKLFGALAVALFGSLVAVANAVLDEKLPKSRLFLAITRVAVAFGGAVIGYSDTKRAHSESQQFQATIQKTTSDLLTKTEQVSQLAAQVVALSTQNASLSSSLAQKSDVIVDLNRALVLPLHGSIRADVSIEVPGDQPSVEALARRLHADAFPGGKQKWGYFRLRQLATSDPAEAGLARFVGALNLYFTFCANENCDFGQQTYKPGQTHGVDLVASAPLGPEIEKALVQTDPPLEIVTLGDHVQVQYDANENRFQIFLHPEPLLFYQFNSGLINSDYLAGKVFFMSGPIDVGAHGVVESIALRRTDNRWLFPVKLDSKVKGGITFSFSRLKTKWT